MKPWKFGVVTAAAILVLATPAWTVGKATEQSFHDCADCPEMVIVPAGHFVMVSPASDGDHRVSETPRHEVVIAKPFALGKFEVKRGEFAAYVVATHYDTQTGGCDGLKRGADLDARTVFPKWQVAQCHDRYVYSAPMESFRPNPFGLYDTLGNAWEVVQNRMHDDYVGAPSDGASRMDGSSEYHVRHGGSWDHLT